MEDWQDSSHPQNRSDRPSSSVGDYRLILVLPIASKVLERHVKDLIDNLVAENAPISKYQWGFMHHRSSTAALLSVIHDWLCALDSGKEVCVVFFDVVDSVPHIPLLQKLEDTGLNPFLLRWIRDYLTNREQSTIRRWVLRKPASGPIWSPPGIGSQASLY